MKNFDEMQANFARDRSQSFQVEVGLNSLFGGCENARNYVPRVMSGGN